MIKKLLGLKRLTTRELCTLAMLLSITAILGIFFTVRIGEGIKIPTKFLPVAISGMLFGPFWGGIIGALADILAYLVNPVGAFMPQITLVEFLYGFTYGMFLRNINRNGKGFFKAWGLVAVQIVFLHFLLTSLLLMPIMGGLSYSAVLSMRSIPAAINLALQLLGISFVVIFGNTFRKLQRK